MTKQLHIRRGLKVLALLVASAAAACTAQRDPTGLVDDRGHDGPGDVIQADTVAELRS